MDAMEKSINNDSPKPITWTEKTLQVADLRPWERNPRRIGGSAKAALKRSLADLGQFAPIIAQADGTIVGGHQRIQAMKELGWESVRVTIPSRELTVDEFKRVLMSDNLPYGEFLADILTEDFNRQELIEYGAPDDLMKMFDKQLRGGATDPDDTPEVQERIISKLGDIWLCGDHRVMCGDSTIADDVTKLMDGKKADMVFTDPPYGVSYADKNKYLNAISRGNRIQTHIENDHMNLEDTSDFIFKAFTMIKNNLAHRSSYYITAPQGGDLMMMMMMMQEAGLTLRHCLIWMKNNHVLGRTDYNYKHEPILYGWNEVHDFYGEGEHKFSVWEIDKPLKYDLHPTMKPIALIVNAILNSTKSGQLVLDIFGGSGSTMIACEQTKRKCLMMELSPAYVDVIVRRWQTFTGKEATHAVTGETFNSMDVACAA